MTTTQLHRAIARATGEDVDLIAARGFSLVGDDPLELDDLPAGPIDWDELLPSRQVALSVPRPLAAQAG
jgi:hypothetical protein